MNKEAFQRGFSKTSAIGAILGMGKLLKGLGSKAFSTGKALGFGGTATAAFAGLDALDAINRGKNWGNKSMSMSMKSPSFYSYRKLPRFGSYKM